MKKRIVQRVAAFGKYIFRNEAHHHLNLPAKMVIKALFVHYPFCTDVDTITPSESDALNRIDTSPVRETS